MLKLCLLMRETGVWGEESQTSSGPVDINALEEGGIFNMIEILSTMAEICREQ